MSSVADQNRQRLRPWLTSKIESGTIPGLLWLDEEKTIFKMPWKHQGKQNWSESDCLLFKEWAIHTGRFRDGIDEPEYATWKTRLRCAFNKAPDIQEQKQQSNLNDPTNPYKVYKLLPKREKKYPDRINTGNNHSDSDEIDYEPQVPKSVRWTVDSHQTFNSNNSGNIMSITENIPSDLKGIESGELKLFQNQEQEPASVVYPEQSYGMIGQMQPVSVTQGGISNSQAQMMESDDSSMVVDLDNGCVMTNNNDQIMVDQLCYPTDARTGAPADCQSPPATVFSFDTFLEKTKIQPNEQEMVVKLNYRSTEVQEYEIKNQHGCRLYYNSIGPAPLNMVCPETSAVLYGPNNVEQIHLPPCNEHVYSQKQYFYTNQLLNSLDRGLVLECAVNGDIYATRLCRCVVFVASPHGDKEPMKLERNKKVKVFEYERIFLPAYNLYATGKGTKPSVRMYFGFGQTWSLTSPFKNLMISSVVVNSKALYLMHQVQGNENDSIQMSEVTEQDEMAESLKHLMSQQLLKQEITGTC